MAFGKKDSKKKDEVVADEASAPSSEAPAQPAVTSAAPTAAKGSRSVVELKPSQAKAILKEGDKEIKVVYHIKRKTREDMIGLPGKGSVRLDDWLSGKASL